jgi:hypothetical protein
MSNPHEPLPGQLAVRSSLKTPAASTTGEQDDVLITDMLLQEITDMLLQESVIPVAGSSIKETLGMGLGVGV